MKIERDAPTKGGYFPLSFAEGFLRFVATRSDRIEVIRYADLDFGEDWDGAGGYPIEKQRFLDGEAERLGDEKKIQLLVQHDVDSRPERSFAMMDVEERLGVPTNVLLFVNRIDRKLLKSTGKLEFTDYDIDFDRLRELQGAGFLFGLHCNAMEQALWHRERAVEILLSDLEVLNKELDVSFFTAHGGVPGPEGLNNNQISGDAAASLGYRWVHNGQSPYFHSQYSDGGLNSPKRDPLKRDLRDYVATWEPGKRYRVLLHPQYYTERFRPSPRLSGAPWYDEVLRVGATDSPEASWNGVELSWV